MIANSTTGPSYLRAAVMFGIHINKLEITAKTNTDRNFIMFKSPVNASRYLVARSDAINANNMTSRFAT